ncbi:MAG: HpsJ family protein, partial [Cyanobacteriota bacterium]|nr:HpsJ family protein [Cyanobacteriota bacterium]
MITFWHRALPASELGSSSAGRLTPLMRWLGLTLVILLLLQMIVLLGASDWASAEFQQVMVQRLVTLSPMGFIGLLLMLISSRLDHPGKAKLPIRWLICAFSSLFAIAMIAVIPMAISGNQTLAGQANQTLKQRRDQLEEARRQAQNPEALKVLGDQLAQAGQLPATATDEDQQKAANDFVAGQLTQMDQQIQQMERQRNLAVNQRR